MALPELLVNSPVPGEDQPVAVLAGNGTVSPSAMSVLIGAPVSAAGLQASGQWRGRIDQEIILFAGTSGTTLTVIARGAEGSAAAAHADGADVFAPVTAGGLTAAFDAAGLSAAETARATAVEGTKAATSALTAEAATARANEGVNAAAITSEATARAAADTTNATAISAEASRATTAESANATAITAEATRATAAEASKASTAALSAETSRATAAEGTNATAITAETTRAEAAEALALAKTDNLASLASPGTARYNIHAPDLTAAAVVATANVALSGLQTIDGYTLLAGDHVLATGQSTGSQNGPWIAAAGAMDAPCDIPVGRQHRRGHGRHPVDRHHPGNARRRRTLATEDEHGDHGGYGCDDVGASAAALGGNRKLTAGPANPAIRLGEPAPARREDPRRKHHPRPSERLPLD